MSKLVIAIDGPAGAGKSTVAKLLAHQLGLRFLDTGAMYRALALKAQRIGIGPDDAEGIAAMGHGTSISFGQGEPQPVLLDGADVTAAIRTLEMSDLASAISTHTAVRRVLVERQQAVVAEGGVILEGRDATTVIAPHAHVKVYMTASLEERAKRRQLELELKGLREGYETVRNQVELRDHRDITRDDSPLTVAPGATVVETAGFTIEQVAAKIIALIPEAMLGA